jgi:hypothetical protein
LASSAFRNHNPKYRSKTEIFKRVFPNGRHGTLDSPPQSQGDRHSHHATKLNQIGKGPISPGAIKACVSHTDLLNQRSILHYDRFQFDERDWLWDELAGRFVGKCSFYEQERLL